MLSQEQVDRVRELLSANLSQREVSRITGISRDAVHRIFKGRWQPFSSPPPNTDASRRNTRARSTGNRVGRCPECGARVLLPCIACRIGRKISRAYSGI